MNELSPGCQTCALPDISETFRYAIVWPPRGHVLKKIETFLTQSELAFDCYQEDGFLVANVSDSETFTQNLRSALTAVEASDTRILLTNSTTPALGAFRNVVRLSTLVDQMNARWLITLLNERRYVSYAQPIVSADGEWDIVAHEFLFRGLSDAGDLIPPDTLFAAAKDPQVLFNLDRAARIHAVKTAAKMKTADEVFINFLPGAVYDPNVCLRTTVAAAKKHGISNDRIVIEIVESHQVDDMGHLREIVNFYRDHGFRVALDDFGTGFNNLDMYIALNPDFVKLDKSLTSNLTDDDPRLGMVKGIVRTAHTSGIKVIAEGIETATNARVVSDCGVDRMQGYFFGRPAAVD